MGDLFTSHQGQAPPGEPQPSCPAQAEFVICDCTIERLFRWWKEGGKIDEWRGRTPWRILCEIYAKVMAMLIEHWFLVVGTWHDPYRSLVKAAKVVRGSAPELLSALVGESSWQRVTARLVRAMQACRLHRRLKHPSHPQLLLEGLDWRLT